jgi:HD superfamily phosphodiesterase|uniref:HD domain-containing protein n=1 Tax=viral metagenome TaxID=1070528 RepID=A0A6C0LQZ4_9ZZZZ
MSLLTKLFNFVLFITAKYNIDESHGMSHSMNVLHNAHNIYENEVTINPFLVSQEKIIMVSAVLHDLCDKKYMDETEGIYMIEEFLEDKMEKYEIDITKQIISTMSYSTVKKNGFPKLGLYQHAYHIVREADLLDAYDFDRCMIYNIHKLNGNIEHAYIDAYRLFQNRVFKHRDDGLLITHYSIKQSNILETNALNRIDTWRKILNKPILQ